MTHEFRAWIPKPVAELADPSRGMMFYQEDQYLASFLSRAYTYDCNRQHESYISEGFTLMLWSGMLDVEKKKIFESDIIEDAEGKIGVVYFESGCFMANFGDTPIILALCNDSKVIGNLFEKPKGEADG